MKIILGSTSPHRKKVLEDSNYEFEIITAPIDEKSIRSDSIEELPKILANAKMDALVTKVSSQEHIVVTADQVARCNGILFEKPEMEKDFRERIPLFEEYGVDLISTLCVFNPINKKRSTGSEICHVTFNPASEEDVQKSLDARDWQTCCAFNDTFRELCMKEMSHSIDSVKGIPLALLDTLIKEVS